MGFLSNDGVTALWNKVKANFGRSLSVSGATITLNNGAATPSSLSQVTIPDATTSSAGVMTAAMVTKLDTAASTASTASSAATNAQSAADNAAAAASNAQATADAAAKAAADGADDHKWNTTTLNREVDSSVTCYVPMIKSFSASNNSSGTDAYLMPAYASVQKSNSFVIRSNDGGILAATMDAGDNSTKCATTAFVNTAIANAQMGAATYKGSVSSNTDISTSDYKAGWYWVVGTAGTYADESCEVGDMIFANSDKGGAYSASHFDVIQSNIVEMTASEVEAICVV